MPHSLTGSLPLGVLAHSLAAGPVAGLEQHRVVGQRGRDLLELLLAAQAVLAGPLGALEVVYTESRAGVVTSHCQQGR